MVALLAWALGTSLGRMVSIAVLCVALLLGARLWLSAHDASVYAAGSAHERQAWIDQREEDKAKQLAKAAADQRQIDQIEADYRALQGQLAETQTALDEAIKAEGADQKPALPKSISKALNQVGR